MQFATIEAQSEAEVNTPSLMQRMTGKLFGATSGGMRFKQPKAYGMQHWRVLIGRV